MGVVTDRQRALLEENRRRQNRRWAARSADERFEAACGLRAGVRRILGTLEGADSDEPRNLWLEILERRARLGLRTGRVP